METNMPLLSAEDIETIIGTINVTDESDESNTLEDGCLKACLNYARFLDLEKTRIIEINSALSVDDLLYSGYYWFVQYKNRFFELYGHDEGLEQQAYKMIERISADLGSRFNWTIIEQIDNGAIKTPGPPRAPLWQTR
ncbi:MAG: hypothetical protein FWG03_04345 [Clostridiales bacterium]|nr:hypothetical protein [Clostridiales bacterium]